MDFEAAFYLYFNMAIIVIAGLAVVWLYIRVMKYLNLKIKYLKKLLDSD